MAGLLLSLAVVVPCAACEQEVTKQDYVKTIIAKECAGEEADAEALLKCRRRIINGLARLSLADMKENFPPPDIND